MKQPCRQSRSKRGTVVRVPGALQGLPLAATNLNSLEERPLSGELSF